MNARINLNGQGYSSVTGGPNSDGRIHIDRTMPAILHDRIAPGQWTSFCDRVDAILTDVGPVRQKMKCVSIIQIVVTLLMFVAIGATSATGVFFRRNFYIFPVIFIFIPLGLYVCMIKPIIARVRKGIDDLNRLCAEESSKYSDVSFHLREERLYTGYRSGLVVINYIECNVGLPTAVAIGSTQFETPSVEVYPSAPTSEAFSMFSAMASNNSNTSSTIGGRNTIERLRDLESIRPLISEEEYLQKKREILAEI